MTCIQKQNLVNQIHYFSGIVLALFIGAHLLNQLYALNGPEVHIRLMEKMRKIYRQPLIEGILLLAVIVQVVTGLKLLLNRKKKKIAEKIQIYSGIYLSLFLTAHVSAVLTGRFIEDLDTNFYFAGAGLNSYPLNLLFIPYYVFAVGSISLHIASLHYLKTGSKWSSYLIGTVGILVSVLIILGYTHFFQWHIIPEKYHQFMQKYFGRS